MPLGSPLGFVVILRELQRRRHLLVGQKPVAMRIVQIIRAILKEHSDRLGRSFADERRINITAAAAGDIGPKCNAGETANLTEHLSELIGTLPYHGVRANFTG